MHTSRGEHNSDLDQLRAEISAFQEEMRQAALTPARQGRVSFILGAGTALTVFVVVTLLQRFA